MTAIKPPPGELLLAWLITPPSRIPGPVAEVLKPSRQIFERIKKQTDDRKRMDLEIFVNLLERSNIQYTLDVSRNHAGRAVDFHVGPGIAGSPQGIVTAYFNEDDKLTDFGFCD